MATTTDLWVELARLTAALANSNSCPRDRKILRIRIADLREMVEPVRRLPLLPLLVSPVDKEKAARYEAYLRSWHAEKRHQE